MQRRLKARIKSLSGKVTERRMMARLGAISSYDGRDHPCVDLYVRAGAQRDLVKFKRDSRAAQLAYAFLRLRPYRMVERTCHTPPDWNKVRELVNQYGRDSAFDGEEKSAVLQQFAEWQDSAATKLSEEARDTLHGRWLAQRQQREQASVLAKGDA